MLHIKVATWREYKDKGNPEEEAESIWTLKGIDQWRAPQGLEETKTPLLESAHKTSCALGHCTKYFAGAGVSYY